jgi:(1->4)-alpha-D-glucan 1-alpha-D-glucosylmutase
MHPERPRAVVPRIATYRVQFTPSFGFRAARSVIPYLRDLGISHVYASPIARATPGSLHGYDVCDPREVNPDLGTFDDLIGLMEEVRRNGMGWIQDVVPNHLAMSPHNPFLRDVLTFGQRSRWSFLFDIDWTLPDFTGRILLPVLGDSYAQLLESGAFHFTWDETGPVFTYGDHRLPLAPGSVAAVLERAGAPPDLCTALLAAEHEEDPDQRAVFLWSALQRPGPELASAAEQLERIHDPAEVDRILQAQPWQLVWWRTGREVIGYRRFFAVDSLIAVRCEDERAFPLMHGLVFELHDRGLLSGVRVDHIDGLRDPRAYLERLRARLPDSWILVEKILAHTEPLPEWPVDGTTGYEVINALTGLCCNPRAEARLTTFHQRIVGARTNPTNLAATLRQDVDRLGLGGDLDRAVTGLRATAADTPVVRDFGRRSLRDGLAAMLAFFPVYRTYIDAHGGSAHDRQVLTQACTDAKRAHADLAPVIDAIAEVFERALVPGAPASVLEAVQRIQQLSGPVMAKGWEDTFLYRWSRCLALNEVGGDPRRYGPDAHGFLVQMGKRPPSGGLNATSTHDTKRGEDVRMRLAALTWRLDQWQELVLLCETATAASLHRVADTVAPIAEDRYQLYQTLVGTWPVDGRIDEEYRTRIRAYALKAMREADCCTSWTTPNPTYEAALLRWLDTILVDPAQVPTRLQITALVQEIVPHAASLALVQTMLKCTIPGIPDVYQGAEWHDLSLVDPDNRREVDFAARAATLVDARLPGHPLTDPRTKQALLAGCLRLRHARSEPWRSGGLKPLVLTGDSDGIVAFARVADEALAVVVVKLHPDAPDPLLELTLDSEWQPRAWREALTGRYLTTTRTLSVAPLLQRLPCAILVAE